MNLSGYDPGFVSCLTVFVPLGLVAGLVAGFVFGHGRNEDELCEAAHNPAAGCGTFILVFLGFAIVALALAGAGLQP